MYNLVYVKNITIMSKVQLLCKKNKHNVRNTILVFKVKKPKYKYTHK